MKKSQISVIEMAFVLMLFILVLSFISFESSKSEQDYKYVIESFIETIYSDLDFRYLVMNEDLKINNLNNDWEYISFILDKSFTNYELILLNEFDSKKIFSCNETYEKYYVEKIMTIYNGDSADVFEFRKIRLGVCY